MIHLGKEIWQDMKNFEIINLAVPNRILVLIYTSESPFSYIKEIANSLEEIGFNGTVIIDELLHSGNNDERFIECIYKDGEFSNESFSFINVPKQNHLHKYICDYLRNDYEYLSLSGLSSVQKKLIEKDCVI